MNFVDRGSRKDDPYQLGYFIGEHNPAGGERFLAAGDTPERRKPFVNRAIEKYPAAHRRLLAVHSGETVPFDTQTICNSHS
jgi:hypothetical protein